MPLDRSLAMNRIADATSSSVGSRLRSEFAAVGLVDLVDRGAVLAGLVVRSSSSACRPRYSRAATEFTRMPCAPSSVASDCDIASSADLAILYAPYLAWNAAPPSN